MAADEPKYVRLTRNRVRSRGGFVSTGYCSLWLGPDHLLCIDSTGYTEHYKRFYFRDIQAIIIRKTMTWKVSTLVLGMLAGICAAFAVAINDTAGKYTLAIVGGFFALLGGLQLAFGPTTDCFLQTAVQTEPLSSLNRLRRARKALALLRPLIASAQGEVNEVELTRRYAETRLVQAAATGTTLAPAAGTATVTEGASPPIEAPPKIDDDPNVPPRIGT